MIPGQDPYFIQYCRINFDGTGLTKLTDADGDHTRRLLARSANTTWTPGRASTCRRSAQLRRTDDQKLVMDLEKGDASALLAAGFKFPEVFVAKGRDGDDRHLGHHHPAH